MSWYSKHQLALVVELLADKLIRVYREEQIPAMVDASSSAGFTHTALTGDPVKLFQLLVIAAYDRRPFTPEAGGFEEIWGMHPGAQSIPKALQSLSLFTPQDVQSVDRHSLRRRLDQPYFGCSLATDAKFVQFDQTLLDLAQLIETGFHGHVLQARLA